MGVTDSETTTSVQQAKQIETAPKHEVAGAQNRDT